MSEQLRESLSAAMDDEADAFELRRVLDEATQDDATQAEGLREQWHRFHLVRDVLKDQSGTYQPGLRDSLFQALTETPAEQEDPLLVAKEAGANESQRFPWLGRIAGTAVAATVAVGIMFNGGFFEQSTDSVEYAGVAGAEAPATLPVMYPQATSVDLQRQNGLMLHHIQQRAMNQRGLTSFVKMATFRGAPLPLKRQRPTETEPRP